MAQDSGYKFSEAIKVKLDQGKLNLNGAISSSGEFDIYQFKLKQRSKFDCALNLDDDDVELALFDRRGNQISVSDNDDGDDDDDNNSKFRTRSRVQNSPLSIKKTLRAGLYFLGIRSLEQDTETEATEIEYSCDSSAIELPGRTRKEALKINSKKLKLKGSYRYSGTLSSDSPVGFYQFNLTQQSSFSSFVKSLGDDVEIELYDSNQQQITISNNSLQLLDTGKYFVKLSLKVKSESVDYKLKLKFDAVPIDFSGNNVSAARVVSASPSVSVFKDYVGVLDSDDYYKVNIASPSSLNLVLDGLAADANLEVLDQSGTVVGSSNVPGTAKDLVNLSLKGGTYYVRVTAGANASTSYNLSFTSAPLKL
ncbi:PPC domain-containing protein, partial [Leptolyngbya sp. FACHB-711]